MTSITRRLHLLRHAKSRWDEPTRSDHDRSLAPRGLRAAEAMAAHLLAAGVKPQRVLCSSARRTVQTLEGIRDALPADADVQVDDGLYAADAATLLDRLRQIPDEVSEAMLIGHNPGIEMLASGLVRAGDPADLARLAAKYPTGALASLRFEGSWAGLAWDAARLEAFVAPRDLAGA